MAAYPGFVKMHSSISLLEEYLENRFKQRECSIEFLKEWKKWENKYVVKL